MTEYLERIPPYCPVAFASTEKMQELAEDIRQVLVKEKVDCDTLVGTGLSGALVVPLWRDT